MSPFGRFLFRSLETTAVFGWSSTFSCIVSHAACDRKVNKPNITHGIIGGTTGAAMSIIYPISGPIIITVSSLYTSYACIHDAFKIYNSLKKIN